MRLIKYIIKDKLSWFKYDLKELMECINDCIKSGKTCNKELHKLYTNMIKLRYYSFKIKHSKVNILQYYKTLFRNSYVWNISNYFEDWEDGEEETDKAINVTLGKNNDVVYKIYYTMNTSDDRTEYCKKIKGHTDMIMWCYSGEEQDILSVTRIEL